MISIKLVFLTIGLMGLVSAKLYYIEVKYPLLGDRTKIPLWPMPTTVHDMSTGVSYLKQDYFKITSNLKCDIIDANIKHYQNILFPSGIRLNTASAPGEVLMGELSIEVVNPCPKYPDASMDESYELTVNSGISKLKANSVWGALRGLDTFSQLAMLTDEHKVTIKNSIHIVDSPRFNYRGLLLDTARHYIPVPILRKQLDAMSYSKFNILHWHIVDDQSFPLELKKNQNVTKNGQYTQAHVYTQADIKTIIEHARLRGIRVIPEFDSPGHVESFGRTYKEFITVCWNDGKPYQAIYSIQGEAEIINPTLEGVYPILRDIFAEIKELFVDDYIHLGMDEVYYACWKSNPNISEWMVKMNFTNYNQLEAFYSSKVLQITKDLGKKSVVWQDVYDNGVVLDKDTYIEIWRDTETIGTDRKWYEYLHDVTSNGYKAILSSPWYINFVSYGYQEWFKWYRIDPMQNFTGTAEQAKLLIGGEACMWMEYADGGNLDSRLWPRASVIAERLWSPASVNDPEEAKFRLDEHRCRLLRRGIIASPVLNGYCGDYEYGMENSVVFDPEFNYGWPTLKSSSTNTLVLAKKLITIILCVLSACLMLILKF